jgi:hypothetical protein
MHERVCGQLRHGSPRHDRTSKLLHFVLWEGAQGPRHRLVLSAAEAGLRIASCSPATAKLALCTPQSRPCLTYPVCTVLRTLRFCTCCGGSTRLDPARPLLARARQRHIPARPARPRTRPLEEPRPRQRRPCLRLLRLPGDEGRWGSAWLLTARWQGRLRGAWAVWARPAHMPACASLTEKVWHPVGAAWAVEYRQACGLRWR